tara:strand:- start:369 stop:527 length:159 start_codon:yes stop_codon:yes gene_type:complete
MTRPIFAPNDIKLIRKAILVALQNQGNSSMLEDRDLKELEIIYHRLGRIDGD